MKNSEFKISQTIDVAPEEAWEVIGAVSGVDKWLIPITDCRVEGNKRFCSTEEGSFEEDILNVDHTGMVFEYAIPTQHMIPVKNIHGKMQVRDENGKANITWSWKYEVEEADDSSAQEAFSMVGGMGITGIESLIKEIVA